MASQGLRSGPDLGHALGVQLQSFPGFGRMFVARPQAGFGIFGFWVTRFLCESPRCGTAPVTLSHCFASGEGLPIGPISRAIALTGFAGERG
jgi:hypothetical protein